MGDCFGPKCRDRYKGVVDVWRWSVREVLLHLTSGSPYEYGVGVGIYELDVYIEYVMTLTLNT